MIRTRPIDSSTNEQKSEPQSFFSKNNYFPSELYQNILASLTHRDIKALKLADSNLSDSSIFPLLFWAVIGRFRDKDVTITLKELQELKKLKLDFEQSPAFKLDLSNSDITDAELKSIIRDFPNIHAIDASNCVALTDDGLQHLKGLANLFHLDLSSCCRITDAGLKHLAGLVNLSYLDLSWCQKITNAGLEHLAGLVNLSYLDLRWCDKITSDGLQSFAGLLKLSDLDLSYCLQITNDGLEHLAGLVNLSHLDLLLCSQITHDGMAELLKHLPNLIIKTTNENFKSRFDLTDSEYQIYY
jgi:hypothetical protein